MEEPDDCKETSLPPQDACFEEVTAIFPDICLNYLQPIAKELDFIAQDVINHILDLEDSGQTYTKRPKQTSKKRKREADDQNNEQKNKVLEAKRRYIDPYRPALHKNSPQANIMKQMIAGDFPLVPIRTIQQLLAENNYHLFPTFTAVDNATARVDRASLSWKYKKTPSVQPGKYKAESIDASIESCSIDWEKELMKELQAARLVRSDAAEKDRVKTLAEETERRNFEAAEARGELVECGCCFADVAPNRLVYCNGDVTHSFCLDCCRRNAETQIGLEKYGLECLSTDGCEAGFSYSERKKFLDKNLTSALDRIEQTANIREAMLPNLAQCPFCQYAEEYPPANIDKEFRCRNADCMITSCRLCNFKTHIPKTCDEATLERGVDVRREVEEAMSEALIRNCNKCQTPFIKEAGCNKMTCTRQGCRNVQCYVCSKSCDYRHFNDESRGGTKGNCPLFDSVEERHENDIKEAEKAARKKVLEENPDLSPDFLDFRISKKVKKDDNRRKHREQRIRDRGLYGMRPEGRAILDLMQGMQQENQPQDLMAAPQQQQPQQQPQPQPQQDMPDLQLRRHLKHAAAHHHINHGGAIPAPPAAPFPGNYQDVQWMPQPQQMPQLQQMQQLQQMHQLPPEQQQILAMNPLDWAAFHAGMHYQYRPFQPFDNQNNRQQ